MAMEKSKYFWGIIVIVIIIKYIMPKIQIFATYNSDPYNTVIFCGFNTDINVINFYLINENTNEKKIINSHIYCQKSLLSCSTRNLCLEPCFYNSSINENEKLLIEFIESPKSLNGFFKQSSISSIVIKSNNAQLNITDYGLMFQDCVELKYVDLSNFNFSTAKILKQMFNGDKNLETIIFPNI